MNLRILIILCIITVGGFLYFCSEEDRELQVMSFNVRYDNPADGINAWSNRKDMVYRFINEQQPDIIGFQEALKNQMDDLQGNLESYSHVGVGRNDGKESGEFVPVFYLKDKYELLASSHFWLSETPEIPGSRSWGAALPRIVTWVQLKERQNGYIFYVFNTHFSHVSAYARNESAILLVNKIKTIAGEAPVVLTGDFNAQPDERMYNTLTENWAGYHQLWDSRTLPIKETVESQQTFNGFNPETPEIVIDHIFINGFFNVQTFNTHQVTDNKVFISDHYPITARLSFRMNKREVQSEGKKLMQNAQMPIIEYEQLCFFDSTIINIKPQGQNATIFYTLEDEQPDSSCTQYQKPITLKSSGTIKARAFAKDMYPSHVATQTLIKRKPNDARLIEVIPEADEKYYSPNYQSLFDNKQGNPIKLDDGSWCGFNGTDTDFLYDFKKKVHLEEVYVSCLSQPSQWIVNPSKIEIRTSNDGINYQVVASKVLPTSFNESETEHMVVHLPFTAKASYVKVSVYNGGILPDTHSGRGNPSWTFIDELVVQ
ncbi:endonuclease/exonuclease/phosphatase family protein [Carboxylicivirga mesophila]|uniref:Endonuclease/exonuclease/phosphatase family protein n=1 Tax=Carboxylicivirga mesophila TaxID=1166478 RepID=A0ABS5K503_9BACT|nr:endonuclease/exonuclease/phosphatase family protein [Carboxylicivirga mesophila]MBS2210084.1 endonuclease/exonuclease/phosphatase family protein [Carboxylicivirga mesophila]